MKTLHTELEKKRDEAPQFFSQSPLVVDCSELQDKLSELDFDALKNTILDLGFIPVGVRGIPASMNAVLSKAGWAIMRAGHAPVPTGKAKVKDNAVKNHSDEPVVSRSDSNANQDKSQSAQPQQPASIQSVTIDRPVRTGQQVYAANADLTLLSQTSQGSEIMADGSIHAYGPLRGRVLAGARGNESARIFCNSLQAELIAIAGRYQLLDESDTELKGKPAMIRLQGEKLIIEPLS